jgi:hypothetical protein
MDNSSRVQMVDTNVGRLSIFFETHPVDNLSQLLNFQILITDLNDWKFIPSILSILKP